MTPPESFIYLTERARAGSARTGEEAVEARYSRADLAGRLVVRDEYAGRYLVFEARADFLAWSAARPEAERCYHEVVFGYRPQRLKFDVDAEAHRLDALPAAALAGARSWPADPAGPEPDGGLASLLSELGYAPPPADPMPAPADPAAARAAKARAAVDLLLEAVLDELHEAYYGLEELLPSRADLVVTDSSGPAKYSYHVLALPYYVADSEEAREFTARVLERLPPPVRALVDPDVNKRTQNFRLAGSAKLGTGRYKHATAAAAALYGTAAGVGPADLFVTAPPGARVLPRVYTEAPPSDKKEGAAPRAPALDPHGGAVRAALDVAARAGVTAGHRLREVRGTLMCFTREAPSHCRICGETHHRDSSLLLGLEPAEPVSARGDPEVACLVVEHCRQARGRGRVVGELALRASDLRAAGPSSAPRPPRPARAAPPAPGAQARLVERVAALAAGRASAHEALASEFERLPAARCTVYAEPAMRPYELTPTLAVQAQMKLGKTKALRAYLGAHFAPGGLETQVIRFVTFRQTFSACIAKAFPDFTLYSDVVGDLDHARHPRLIVQVESLHRLRLGSRPEPVDLLVLDEVESILAQFNSGLHRHFGAAFAAFQWMLQTARHVVCMDANLGDRTFRTLARLRPAAPPHFHWNRFARAAGDTYHFTTDQGAWLARLYAELRAGARVVLPSNSLAEARAYEEAVRREFPAKRVALYSSETAPSEKAQHFGDVHSHWGSLDVLIFTPTCSAGVSFELEHYDVLFGYFCDASCDVETCRQMLGRVRNLRSRQHYLCLQARGAALPTTPEDIRRGVYDRRAGLYRAVDGAALQYEYAADGEIRFYESSFFHLWLETVRVQNLSRNDFVARFVDQVADTGAHVAVLGATDASAEEAEAEGAPADASAEEERAACAALMCAHRGIRTELRAARCAAVADAPDLTPEEAGLLREACSRGSGVDVAPAQRLALEKYSLREAYDWHGRPLDAAFVAAYSPPDARRVYRNLLAITARASVLDSLRLLRAQEAAHYDYVMETRGGPFGFAGEGRDLLRDRTTYVFRAHFAAVWLMHVCGFTFASRARIHEAALEARLRAALPALKRALDRIVAEFQVPRPRLERFEREPERRPFLAGLLRFVNAVLRAMYGAQVQRVPRREGGGAYYLGWGPTGRLFAFSREPEDDGAPGGARPHIPSELAAEAPRDLSVNLFLESAYYEGLLADGAAWGDSDDSDGGDGAPPEALAAWLAE